MKAKPTHTSTPAPRRAYKSPKLKVLGNVKKLTLKVGSNTDGLGGFL